jgi:hypothetical protein
LTGVAATSSIMTVGDVTVGTVTLSAEASGEGVPVSLSTDLGALTLPASVTVAPGSQSSSFKIVVANEGPTGTGTITASAGGVNVSTTVSINAFVAIGSLSLSRSRVVAGESFTGTVGLVGTESAAAGVGGFKVDLAADNTAASVPASVTVPEGSSSVDFTVTTADVTAETTVTLRASSPSQSIGPKTTVTVVPSPVAAQPTILQLAVDQSLVGGETGTATVMLSTAAPANGVPISVGTTNILLSVPTSVIVPGGAREVSFSYSALPTCCFSAGNITVSAGGVSQAAEANVFARAVLSRIQVGSSVVGGSSATFAMLLQNGTLSPSNGLTITLTSDNAAVTLPATLAMAGHAGAVGGSLTTAPVANDTSVTLTATENGVSVQATVTVTAH